MDKTIKNDLTQDMVKAEEAKIEEVLGEELTDEQLLQMAEGSCSWGANCNRGC
tara:strand:- start:388 stop:546 length:159 start_codon:yes stop_codon:yes gene_type:complete